MATGTLDQFQNITTSGFGFGEFAVVRYRGQVFTAGLTGSIGTIGFSRDKGSIGIKVYFDTVDGSNFPAHALGSELYSFTITNANIVNGYGEYVLPVPLAGIVAATKYCVYFAPWNTGTDLYQDDYRDAHGNNATAGGVTEITNVNGVWSTENLCFNYKTYVMQTPFNIVFV